LWILCGFVAACLSAFAAYGQAPEDAGAKPEQRRWEFQKQVVPAAKPERRRQEIRKKAVRAMQRMERELQGEGEDGPRFPGDADLAQESRHLIREIAVLKTRLEIAESELRLLHAKARLRMLEREHVRSEDRSEGEAERDRDASPDRMIRGPRGRLFRGGGPDGRPFRGPRDRPDGRSDDRRDSRPEGRENSREEGPGENEAVEGALNQRLVVPFPDPTSLEEVVEFLKRVSVNPNLPSGISFSVDPRGLERAGTSMEAKVRMKSDDLPLRESLRRILSQVGLVFEVNDGQVTITSKPLEELEDDPDEPDSE